MVVKLKKASALDLEIPGSMGTFAVGGQSGRSIKVQFLQSYVRFALGDVHAEKLLSKLAPVREVFPIKDLDFEQIMQRDIDDARVATELIPYLLEESSTGLVKLFPPIIVVVLPVSERKLPGEHYPTVEEQDEVDGENNTWHVIRSGAVGSEVFELRQIVVDGERQDHDYARLRLNTNRSALVIVDGQHRAMGLIAMYRNCTRWPDQSKGVEPYYGLWSKQILQRFDLSEVKLPVMFCVFPELDGRDPEQIKVYNACRAIFLALNKNARRVTRARNFLLDDRDIVSAFMRSVLTDIKERSDIDQPSSVRLWNVELDPDEDRAALSSPTAITGVTHLYGLIERLTLRASPGASLSAKGSQGRPQTKLDTCFRRLQVTDELPRGVREDSRRDTCDAETQKVLVQAFRARFGQFIVLGLSDFVPYGCNNAAALELNAKLQAGPLAEFYRTILFEGQSMDQVFRDYVEGLKKELKDPGRVRSPELKAVKSEFDKREQALKAEIEALKSLRLAKMLAGCPDRVRDSPAIRLALGEVYDHTYTTAAFQAALFITFFAAVDEENEARSKPPVSDALTQDEVSAAFGHYLGQLNEFFKASSLDRLERILGVFYGRISAPDGGEITVAKWSETLRAILIPGELKPDEWSRFRMIFVELWRPKHPALKKRVLELRQHLRKQALDHYHERQKRELAQSLAIASDRLSNEDKDKVRAECIAAFLQGLSWLHVFTDSQRDTTEQQLRDFLERPEEPTGELQDEP